MRPAACMVVLLVAAPFVHAAPVDSACLLQYEDKNDPTKFSAGSGTVIACEGKKSLILTAAHVIPDGKADITVTLKGKDYVGKYLTGSKVTVTETGLTIDGADLALIVVDAELPVTPLAKEMVKKGDRVHQWGFCGGPHHAKRGPYYKTGKVDDVDEEFAIASPDARRGDSGCALCNDKNEIIGVVVRRFADDDCPACIALPLPTINKFLTEKVTGFPQFESQLKPKK